MIKGLSILLLVAAAGTASAFLPDDASAREPQIRAYRQRVRDTYQQRLEERQAESVRAYERTYENVFTPPWKQNRADSRSEGVVDGGAAAVESKPEKRNHRFLVPIMLLIFIGSAAGWVRFATQKNDR
ncbi:MAG: hypothetical protein AB7E95_09795 [Kiritimatiellales bacterium]